jgi:integrase/recombinase XerC
MPTIRDATAKYLAELERRGASKHTVRNYASDLEQFATYFEPPAEIAPGLETLDLPLLREWLAGLYDQGLSTVSIRRKLAAIRAMFKFQVQEGVLATNIARRLRTPKVKQRLPDVMSAEKTNNLLDAAEGSPKERDIAFLELL